MADVILADCEGQVWLVKGDEHIDELLAGTLPAGITVEFLPFTSRAAVFGLWRDMSVESTDGAQPWVLHPEIVRRIRGSFGLQQRVVVFQAWSVLLDPAAREVVADAAEWLSGNAGGTLLLRQFAPDAAAPGHADLQRLRGQLVAGALAGVGADPARMSQDTAAAQTDADAERLEIVIVAASAPRAA